MKNKLLLILFAILAASCTTTQYTVQVPHNVDMPKKILFLSQSGTQVSLYQTVIDLENNEMVILEYSANRLAIVYRTGVFMNPNDYKGCKIEGTDAPVREDRKDDKADSHLEKKDK